MHPRTKAQNQQLAAPPVQQWQHPIHLAWSALLCTLGKVSTPTNKLRLNVLEDWANP